MEDINIEFCDFKQQGCVNFEFVTRNIQNVSRTEQMKDSSRDASSFKAKSNSWQITKKYICFQGHGFRL